MKILFVSDTHLGFDAVKQARVSRRRRSDDFLERYLEALAPALAGRVDAVVHGGDVFDHPDVGAGIVDDAFRPLRQIADRGCPVFVVAGNHERSRIPCPLLAMHPDVHIITSPRTQVVSCGGLRLAVGGFAYVRDVQRRFAGLLEQTQLDVTPADIKLLCVHHCIEGAVVSNPSGDYMFRSAPDVIRTRDLPARVAAVLSGHIHRHQVLTKTPSGRSLAAPVCYPGSVERTSLAERSETKGYMTLELTANETGGALRAWRFHELPARPMVLERLADDLHALDRHVRSAIERAPDDAILHFRAASKLRDSAGGLLAAPRLRALAPPTMNVTVSFETAGATPSRRELRRAAYAR